MTTTQEVQTISELLRRKRDGSPKAPIYRKLGVPANTYDTWEGGLYAPRKAKHIEAIADHLDLDPKEVVWIIYLTNEAKGVYVNSFSRPLLKAA